MRKNTKWEITNGAEQIEMLLEKQVTQVLPEADGSTAAFSEYE